MLKKFICVLRNIFYTISGKFILLSSALTFVSLVVITMFYLDSYDKATESNVYDISIILQQLSNSHIDYMAQDVVDISTFLLTSQIVQEALQFPIYNNYGKPYSSQHYNEANQMLINLINSQTYLGCIHLGNEDISFYQRKVGCSFDFKELYSQEKELRLG